MLSLPDFDRDTPSMTFTSIMVSVDLASDAEGGRGSRPISPMPLGRTIGVAAQSSQGRDLGVVALTMLLFGLGAALPLLLLGTLSREVLMRGRDRMMGLGKGLKAALGLILVATGLTIVLGYDKLLETTLVNASPIWLTNLTKWF